MGNRRKKEVLVASPRGFCAGVSYAIDIVDRVLDVHGAPVYVRHFTRNYTFTINPKQ